MKVLIEGRPASGKSNWARYFKSKHPKISVFDYQDFDSHDDFLSAIRSKEDCIVVCQNFKFFKSDIQFDYSYFASKTPSSFILEYGLLSIEFSHSDMYPYYKHPISPLRKSNIVSNQHLFLSTIIILFLILMFFAALHHLYKTVSYFPF